jgi:hypothetical protein
MQCFPLGFGLLLIGDVVECNNEVIRKKCGIEFANPHRTILAGNVVLTK